MTDDRLSHKRTGASAVESRSTDTEPDSAAPQTPPIPHADSGADSSPVTAADPGFDALRRLTSARIGLGRSGTSLPTRALLDFQFAHAQARDAVHTPLDTAALTDALTAKGIAYVQVKSAATDRDTYLKRPDLGRRLDADAAKQLVDAAKALYNAAAPLQETDESLQKIAKPLPETDESLQTAAEPSRMAAGQRGDAPNTEAASPDVCIVVADGLSARAIHQHAAEMVGRILAFCKEEGWTCAPIVIVEQGRVAIADEIGELIGARMSAILIGERPGLSSPDSLGIYFTYGPKTGLSDAARNCLSNIRPEGQNYTLAAHRLRYLMQQATQRKLSGVALKDEAEIPTVGTSVGNFWLD